VTSDKKPIGALCRCFKIENPHGRNPLLSGRNTTHRKKYLRLPIQVLAMRGWEIGRLSGEDMNRNYQYNEGY